MALYGFEITAWVGVHKQFTIKQSCHIVNFVYGYTLTKLLKKFQYDTPINLYVFHYSLKSLFQF